MNDNYMKCQTCGKKMWLLRPGIYAYKRGNKYFCSYSCMRIYDTDNSRSVPIVAYTEAGEVFGEYPSIAACNRVLGTSYKSIWARLNDGALHERLGFYFKRKEDVLNDD